MNSPCGLWANFGPILKHWRLSQNLAQKAIASDLDVRISVVSAWETGARFPNSFALQEISAYTGITPCRIFCNRTARCAPSQCALLNRRM